MDKMRCILKYMVAVLFMVIMMCCIGTSFTVYAAGEWTVDGDAKDYVYIPGGTYWGGSTSRTGALIYCVDKETKKIVPNTITVLYNKTKDENGEVWIGETYTKMGHTRVGDVYCGNATFRRCSELPITGDWSNSDGSPLKSWLEADSNVPDPDEDGAYICNAAKLTKLFISDQAFQKVNHGKYSVCVEGMYGMAMYTKAENPATKEVEDAAYSLPESLVKSENPSLTGEELDKKRVFKYFTTLRSFVKECSERGISVADRDGATGTANYKWIQSCARYFSISEEHYGVSAATGGESL